MKEGAGIFLTHLTAKGNSSKGPPHLLLLSLVYFWHTFSMINRDEDIKHCSKHLILLRVEVTNIAERLKRCSPKGSFGKGLSALPKLETVIYSSTDLLREVCQLV